MKTNDSEGAGLIPEADKAKKPPRYPEHLPLTSVETPDSTVHVGRKQGEKAAPVPPQQRHK